MKPIARRHGIVRKALLVLERAHQVQCSETLRQRSSCGAASTNRRPRQQAA